MSTPPLFFQSIHELSLNAVVVSKEPTVNLLTWLQQVAYHSQSTSYEDTLSIKALSLNIPSIDNAPEEVIEVIHRVKEVVERKIYDPTLSPKSKNAYSLILARFAEKPKCARRLNFSSDSGDWM